MIRTACAVILLHAMVPHHHHDCADEAGIVFETELNCHCNHQHYSHDCSNDCDEHHSDHPFDCCRLADMLSHLVISNKEDEHLLAIAIQGEMSDLMAALLPESMVVSVPTGCPHSLYSYAFTAWALPLPPLSGGNSLRAPPLGC